MGKGFRVSNLAGRLEVSFSFPLSPVPFLGGLSYASLTFFARIKRGEGDLSQ